jgi:hypothetical protein
MMNEAAAAAESVLAEYKREEAKVKARASGAASSKAAPIENEFAKAHIGADRLNLRIIALASPDAWQAKFREWIEAKTAV